MRAGSAPFCSTRSSIFASDSISPFGAVGIERIDSLGRHPELESDGSDTLIATSLGQSVAGVSNYPSAASDQAQQRAETREAFVSCQLLRPSG
jgi:hypothetical protein